MKKDVSDKYRINDIDPSNNNVIPDILEDSIDNVNNIILGDDEIEKFNKFINNNNIDLEFVDFDELDNDNSWKYEPIRSIESINFRRFR